MPRPCASIPVDEPTYPAFDHESSVCRHLAASLVPVLASDAAADAALIVIARGDRSVGAQLTDAVLTDLDGLDLDELLTAIDRGDELAIAAACEAHLPGDHVDHAVAHDSAGRIAGVAAVSATAGLHGERARRALTRMASALAGWAPAVEPEPARELLARLGQPAFAHDDGAVIVANRQMAALLGHDHPDELAGAPMSYLAPALPRFPVAVADVGLRCRDGGMVRVRARELMLSIAGRPRRVLAVDEAAAPPAVDPRAAVAAAVGALYPTLRRCGRVHLEAGTSAKVAATPDGLEDVLALALLDAACALDPHGPGPRGIEVRVGERSNGIVVEITAVGAVVAARSGEPIGGAACAALLDDLGGELEVEQGPERRTLRMILPRAGWR